MRRTTSLSVFEAAAGPRSTSAFRIAIALMAFLLGCQSVWLLVPELFGAGLSHVPVDNPSAELAAPKRGAAAFAASFGNVRGDLWTQAAFSYADLLFSPPDTRPTTQVLEQARTSLTRALERAPHQSAAWLLLAGLAQRYKLAGIDPVQALKMSYYTGPSERDLIALRIAIAAKTGFVADFEMRQFVTRDLRWLADEKQRPAIAETYAAASLEGKKFIEETLAKISSPILQWLRSAIHAGRLPD
jgi:hypothetical protein